jgi:hypothetical protein
MGPLCACGCGERLPNGSTRQYKRGHKNDAPNEFNDDGEAPEFSLEDAASITENDPEPGENPQEINAEKPLRITRAIRKDIEGKLAWMISMGATMWSIQDPYCGTVMLDSTPGIAAKLTPILCQSPDVVKWFRKSSNAALYVDLMIALTPVLQAIYAHHIAKQREANPFEGWEGGAQAPQYAA